MLHYTDVCNGEASSYVESGNVVFMVRGHKVFGYTYTVNTDLKALYNYQVSTLNLFREAMVKKKISDKWNRHRGLNWLRGYDVKIANKIAWIYRRGVCVASFGVFTDDSTLLEYYLEMQMKLIERYLNPKKSKK